MVVFAGNHAAQNSPAGMCFTVCWDPKWSVFHYIMMNFILYLMEFQKENTE